MTAPPLRTSSGLVSTALSDVRARVAYWLERARSQHGLSEEHINSVAGVAAVAANDVVADVYRAGVATGRVAVALQTGAVLPDGAEECRCPHCGKSITTP